VSNGETPSEDRTILAAVEALEGTVPSAGAPAAPGQEQTAETETLARLYTEVLGLIPFELEPIAPPPQGRERLLAMVQGTESRPAAEPAPVPAPPRGSRETPIPRLIPPGRPAVAMARRPSRWPLAIAAVLALMALGLSGWLYQQLSQERATVASLRKDLQNERARVAAALAEARDLRTASSQELATLRQRFALVTSPAVQVSAMRPAGRSPLQPAARGILFVAADHQHWYLTLRGLQPAPEGTAYKLWFVAKPGRVSSGSFTARPGEALELSSETMPADTSGAIVTLEQDPGVSVPTGPEILRSEKPYETS
jgi:anti-sigma-K factor RskA